MHCWYIPIFISALITLIMKLSMICTLFCSVGFTEYLRVSMVLIYEIFIFYLAYNMTKITYL